MQVGYVFRCVCLWSFHMLGRAFSISFFLSFSFLPSSHLSFSSTYYWLRLSFNLLKLAKLIRKVWRPLYGQCLRKRNEWNWIRNSTAKGFPESLALLLVIIILKILLLINGPPHPFKHNCMGKMPILCHCLFCWKNRSECNGQTALCPHRDSGSKIHIAFLLDISTFSDQKRQKNRHLKNRICLNQLWGMNYKVASVTWQISPDDTK